MIRWCFPSAVRRWRQRTVSTHLSVSVPGQSAICIKLLQHVFYLQAAVWTAETQRKDKMTVKIRLKPALYFLCDRSHSTFLTVSSHSNVKKLLFFFKKRTMNSDRPQKNTEDVHALLRDCGRLQPPLDMRNHEQV